jgi:hypothetical protein
MGHARSIVELSSDWATLYYADLGVGRIDLGTRGSSTTTPLLGSTCHDDCGCEPRHSPQRPQHLLSHIPSLRTVSSDLGRFGHASQHGVPSSHRQPSGGSSASAFPPGSGSGSGSGSVARLSSPRPPRRLPPSCRRRAETLHRTSAPITSHRRAFCHPPPPELLPGPIDPSRCLIYSPPPHQARPRRGLRLAPTCTSRDVTTLNCI